MKISYAIPVCNEHAELEKLLDFLHKHIDELIKNLIEKGVRMINKKSMEGAGGHKIAFVHPESTGGVLVELVQRVDI